MKVSVYMKRCLFPLQITFLLLISMDAFAQETTTFTYQGRLDLNGSPANGQFDLRFELFETLAGGGSRIDPSEASNVAVSNGLFVAQVDFGPLADKAYWMEIGVRPAGSGSPFTLLNPRQRLTPTPYANFARRAGSYEGPIGDYQLSPNVLVAGPGATIGPLNFVAPTRPVAYPPFTVNTSLLVSNLNADLLDGFSSEDFWKLGGNADTVPGTHYLGTSDIQPLELRANLQLGLRVEPNPNTNIANVFVPGTLSFGFQPRQMIDLWGTHYGIGVQDHTLYFRTRPGGFIGVGGNFAWFAGGQHSDTTFDPGLPPLFGTSAELMRLEGDGQLTVFGTTRNGVHGRSSDANGLQGSSATAAASGVYGENTGGGFGVAGRTTGNGSAIYGDNASTSGWAGNFNGRVNVSGNQHFGSQTRQMLNLWGDTGEYGIGVQSQTLYFRADGAAPSGGFAWFKGGSHVDNLQDPGSGGQKQMVLDDRALWVEHHLELGPSFGSGNAPHIDFHFGTGTSQDFNVRIINDAPNVLSFFRNSSFSTPMAQFSASGLFVNGAFVHASDRNAKENIQPVDPRAVLDKIMAMPISEWNYKEDKASRHIGPMAQDFRAAFNLGLNDTSIATVDADGVALAGIQGLHQKLEEKEARIKALERTVSELKQLVERLTPTP